LSWFDRWLKGAEPEVEEAPVRLFVMGIDQWRDEQDRPLPDTTYHDWYLHSGGAANSRHGDGELSEEKPANEQPDTFLYDPLRPVPTVGGPLLVMSARGEGPWDQRHVENRDDVLVYTSAVLDRPLEVTGPVSLTLHVASSARDTDFTGKLVDVHPDGRALNLTEGIMRARYRNSPIEPALMEPGEVYELTWICGRRQTSSCPAIASDLKYQAATSHGSLATQTRAARSLTRAPTTASLL